MSDSANGLVNNEIQEGDLEVFISHPHKYAAIADVLRETITDWSSGLIKVHETSDAGSNPISVGEAIRPQLEECLRKASLVLFIYWNAETANYCMWEVGFAVARGEAPLSNTRIVVFQCDREIPAVFKDDLLVRLTKDSIKKFTHDFHRNDKFFPNLGHAFAKTAPDTLIERRSQVLHNALINARPTQTALPQTWKRWVSFTISLDEAHANEIEQISNAIEESFDAEQSGLDKALIRAKELIEKFCIIEDYPSHMPNHFDMADFPKGSTKFITLYNRWKNWMLREGGEDYLKIDWWDEICSQITLAIGSYNAREIETPFKSASETQTWYLPVLTDKIIFPADKKIAFNISLIRIPQKSSAINIVV